MNLRVGAAERPRERPREEPASAADLKDSKRLRATARHGRDDLAGQRDGAVLAAVVTPCRARRLIDEVRAPVGVERSDRVDLAAERVGVVRRAALHEVEHAPELGVLAADRRGLRVGAGGSLGRRGRACRRRPVRAPASTREVEPRVEEPVELRQRADLRAQLRAGEGTAVERHARGREQLDDLRHTERVERAPRVFEVLDRAEVERRPHRRVALQERPRGPRHPRERAVTGEGPRRATLSAERDHALSLAKELIGQRGRVGELVDVDDARAQVCVFDGRRGHERVQRRRVERGDSVERACHRSARRHAERHRALRRHTPQRLEQSRHARRRRLERVEAAQIDHEGSVSTAGTERLCDAIVVVIDRGHPRAAATHRLRDRLRERALRRDEPHVAIGDGRGHGRVAPCGQRRRVGLHGRLDEVPATLEGIGRQRRLHARHVAVDLAPVDGDPRGPELAERFEEPRAIGDVLRATERRDGPQPRASLRDE